MIEFLRTDMFLIILAGVNIFLILINMINILKNYKQRKDYKKFMNKLGNSTDIYEDLKSYIHKVEKVEEKTEAIIDYCENVDLYLAKCLQKIGVVRYSAFKDTGSDLSFALALLDQENNGIVLNGIYSRDGSNVYAKPIKKGSSEYTLSEEEKEAINRAVNISSSN